METFYLFSIILIFLLSIFDLYFGVSKDIVRVLSLAIGSKTGGFKTIIFIAAIGILSGIALSNGMTDIARNGIFQPQHYYFSEIMCILMGVMFADVILLSIFNALELQTSTTISIIFTLIGGTFALALVKIVDSNGHLHFGDLMNTDKSLLIIIGIFLFAAIAFISGVIVQYITRLIFSFNYTKNMKYFIGVFGGLAATAIIYFILINGLKGNTLLSEVDKSWIKTYTVEIVSSCFVFFSILMQVLHWSKVNVFKVIVGLGTFALAFSFAGNDLMNFIGVPIAGFSAWQDFTANGAGSPATWPMTSLAGPASVSWYILFAAGTVLILSLYISNKSIHKTEIRVYPSEQEEMEESFGTTPLARSLLRTSSKLANTFFRLIPDKTGKWINTRFNKDESVLENGVTFDIVRTSVNLILSGLLISFGTTLKLPMSTAYIVFMVALGSSFSDRAWGRDNAVYHITGVLSVIGGWLITAGIAFALCFFITLALYYGGLPAILVLIALSALAFVKSRIFSGTKQEKSKSDPFVVQLMGTKDTNSAYDLFRQHIRKEENEFIGFASRSFEKVIDAFLNEDLRELRKQFDTIEFKKDQLKKDKHIGTLAMRYFDTNTTIVKGGFYYQSNDLSYEIIKSLERICEPCMEHVDNNFSPLAEDQKSEFRQVVKDLTIFLNKSMKIIQENDYNNIENVILEGNLAINKLMSIKKNYFDSIRIQACSARLGMVCLTVIQEAQNIGAYAINLLKVSRKFQND